MPRSRSRRPSTRSTGRLVPPNYDHVAAFRWEVTPGGAVEVVLDLPSWHVTHDQGKTGSCVGHAVAMERAITNETQQRAQGVIPLPSTRYDPLGIWRAAKAIDTADSSPSNDDDGTTLLAGYQVTQDPGPSHVTDVVLDTATDKPEAVDPQPPDPMEGVVGSIGFATTPDEVRGALAAARPVVIGVRWLAVFDAPERWYGEAFLPGPSGGDRGHHAVCIFGASDEKQAFLFKNSWRGYPECWMAYDTLGGLLTDGGEAVLVTDI